MRFILDSGILTEINPIMDRINSMADAFIDKEAQWLVHPILNLLGEGLHHLGMLLNDNSAEIITFAITCCAGGMMIASLIGASTSKWFGKTFTVFWLGVIWRVLIA